MGVSNSPDVFVEDDSPPVQRPPGTWKALGLLLVAAGTFSYLGAFAATDALAKANVIRPISHEHDPRLRWAGIMFVSILALFLFSGILMRYLSSRQFRRIDQMLEADAGR